METVFAPEIQSLAQANKLTYDETLKLREQNYQTADTVYIFEFKVSGKGTADDAIAQIKKKQYDETYQADGKKIVLIGAGFDEQAKNIKDWKTEAL